ncbi:serine proteinase stubble-like isoform X3 [Zootermopsis nevadensis]|uniref:serine proteinase stubble-like isoform X3 n=1 Tax=Zootermopsis nevadensis TaxID=136037 RepID=UPI000B8E31B9|nr:serine proteinase stubble-like isoform X3 [Zootermopsis nevadensis]
MVCGQVLGILLAAQTLGPSWSQPFPTSPCPGIFQYLADSSGNWHGLITVPAPQPSYTFKITVEMALEAVLRTQYVGSLRLLENENVVWRRINTGDRQPIQFHQSFPITWPLPTVTSITSNGNVICIGNTPNKVFTKLYLEHILYPIRGAAFPQPNQDTNHPLSVSSYATACPNVFRYQQSRSGEWYGVISVPNPYPIVAIDIRVEIYVTGTMPLITNGFLNLVNKLNEEWDRIRRGERYYIQYKLDFPLYQPDSSMTSPLPAVKSIIVNNEVLCSGNKPSFSAVRILLYQHSIFSERCTSSSLDCPYNIEQTRRPITPTLPVYIQTPPVTEIITPSSKQTPIEYGQTTTKEPFIPPMYTPVTEIITQSSKPTPIEYGQTTTKEPIIPPMYTPVTEIITQSSKPTPIEYGQTTTKEPIIPPMYTPVTEIITQSSKPTPIEYGQTTTNEPILPPMYTPVTEIITPSSKPTPMEYGQTTTKEPILPPMYTTLPVIQRTGLQCGMLVVRTNPLITYGEDTVIGQWPWHAALYLYMRRDIRYRCGGSLIGIKTVITAAHCVTKNDKQLAPGDIIVYLGRYNLRNLNEEGSQNRDVTKVTVHPSYNATSTVGDIAVLTLSTSVEVTVTVRPVCLWDQENINPAYLVNKEGLVVGWGLNEYDEPTETLKMVTMPVVSQQACIWSDPNYYSHFTSNTTFCAGYRNGSSVCNGDSGGGMVFLNQDNDGTQMWMLRGIVSHSRRRDGYANICDTKSYIVFTDVAQYLSWIYTILI